MTQFAISWIPAVAAGLAYLAAGTRVVRAVSSPDAGVNLAKLRWAAMAAALLHLVAVAGEMCGPGGVIHFGFGLAVSVALLLAVFITLLESWVRKVSGLMGVLLIVAAVAAVMPVFFPGEAVPAEKWSVLFRVHLLAALAAYSFMTIAFVQAVLLALLQRQLKDPAASTQSGLVANLPNLMAMERILYRIVLLGFLCLTLGLVLGAFATNEAFGQYLVFDHKTVLTWLAWIVFAVLLVGRYFFGWRNKQARAWFWAGYAILVVAYLVYRLIFELFLI